MYLLPICLLLFDYLSLLSSRSQEMSSKLIDVKGNTYMHRVSRSKDVMISLVSGATRYTFPVTSMIFRYAVAQPLEVLRSRGKGKVTNGDSTMLDGYGSEIAISKAATLEAVTIRNSENKLVRDTQLRQLLLVTTRVVPILRLVKPLQRWQRGGVQRGKDTGGDVMDVELEREKDSFVHVGDSERFYDLWKDESKSKNVKDGASVEGTNSQRGYEIGEYSPNFSFDEEAVSDSMKGKGQGVSLPGGAVRGVYISIYVHVYLPYLCRNYANRSQREGGRVLSTTARAPLIIQPYFPSYLSLIFTCLQKTVINLS